MKAILPLQPPFKLEDPLDGPQLPTALRIPRRADEAPTADVYSRQNTPNL